MGRILAEGLTIFPATSQGGHRSCALCRSERGNDPAAKPLKGFGGGSILEIVADHRGDTWRSVYTVRFSDAVYVLHAFQKKSKSGIATPKKELALIRQRLAEAERDHGERQN